MENFDTSKNLYDTDCLAKCFLITILDMIRGGFGSLQERSSRGFKLIFRGLWEHSVDLRLIVLSNDISLNRRFANHHKLILYNIRKRLGVSLNEQSNIVSEYREYILSEFLEDLKSKKIIKETGIISDWKEIDKYFANKHWTRVTFADRIKRIQTLTDMAIESGLIKNNKEKDHFFEVAPFFWKVFSSYTHPTPFSAIPHFTGKDEKFKLKYEFDDQDLRNLEEYFFPILEFNVESFSIAIKTDISVEFFNYEESLPKTKARIDSSLQRHATRSRDK